MKASDNLFPSVLLVEGTTPASPSASDQRLFVRSSDHVLCLVNSSGVVTPVGGFANPMTTKGDVILGDTSGVPSRLGAGTSGYVLTSTGAGAFPSWQAGGGAAAFMGASAYSSTGQAITSATDSPLLLNTENYDTNAIHDISTNTSRFTVPTGGAGKWQGVAYCPWDTNTGGSIRYMWWHLNGTRILGSLVSNQPISSGLDQRSVLPPVTLADGDYLEACVYQDSGGTRTLTNTGDQRASVAVWRVG